MPKEPARELRIAINPGEQKIEIIMLSDGSPLGSWSGGPEDAAKHCLMVYDAIERVTGHKPKSSLILPPH